MQQLVAILSSKGLPSVINDPQREAYMGRVAFDLPNRLNFMPKDTLKWRLEEWLEWGCGVFKDRLEMLQAARDSIDEVSGDVDTHALLKVTDNDRRWRVGFNTAQLGGGGSVVLRVIQECIRAVVPGAGHASTCGGSLNLIKLLRDVFPETNMDRSDGNSHKGKTTEELHGLEHRYDRAWIGLNPLLYWSKDYFLKWRRD